MTTSATIRPATADDAERIQQVARESWHAAYGDFLDEATIDETVDAWYEPEKLIADDITPDDRAIFVAVADGTVVGFVEVAPSGKDDGVAHLYRIYVVPDFWSRGIGTALLDRAETVLRKRGFDRLVLSVFADNAVGVQFYESAGFERIETTYVERFDTQQHEYAKDL